MTAVTTTNYQHVGSEKDGVIVGPASSKLYFFGGATDTPVAQETSASFTSTLAATTTTTATTTALQTDIDAIRTRLNKLMDSLGENGYNLIASA